MKQSIQLAFMLLIFWVNMNVAFSQIKIAEKDVIGNWMISGGSGQEFEKELIGGIVTFKDDGKAQKMEDGEMLEANWKIEKTVITITYYYQDNKNDPEVETLTITRFDGKKLTADYANDDDEKFIIIMEKAKTP